MSGLVVRHEQAERRERALREVGAKFVAAGDADEIRAAAADAIAEIADQELHARIDLAPRRHVGAAPSRAHRGRNGRPPAGPHGPALEGGPAARGGVASRPRAQGAAAALPSGADRRTSGWRWFQRRALTRETARAVDGLVAQASLALERAQLAEDVHRQRVEARFRSLVQNATDLITVIDQDDTVRYQSPSVRRVLGYEPGRPRGNQLLRPHPRGRRAARAELPGQLERRPEHDRRPAPPPERNMAVRRDDRERPHHDPNVAGIVLNTRDVSERRAFEEQLQHQAFHDTVTGLANRALFHDRVHHALERQGRDGEAAGDPAARPGRLQGGERQPRPRGRRPSADRGRATGSARWFGAPTPSRAWAGTSSPS